LSDIFDTLKKASFGDIEFPYKSISIKGALDHHVHKYLHRPGAEIEALGRRHYEIRYECDFHTDMPSWPGLYPNRLSQLVSLFESEETLPLFVPNLARELPAKCIDWPRKLLATVRSGESVELTFLEDSTDRYTADKLITFTSKTVVPQVDAVQFEVEKLADPVAQDWLDKVLEELDKYLALIESIEMEADYQHARVDGLFDRVGRLARVPVLQTAAGASALRATLALWGTIAEQKNTSLVAARPIAAYTTQRDKMSIVDVSMALFGGDPSRALEILRLNDLDDALAIRVGTEIRYLTP
jgi:hypothetical protein